jgi:hypothetical protein
MTPENHKQPSTPDEAIWEIYSRVVALEVTIRGTPNTQEGGLVQAVKEIKDLAVENKDAYIEQGKAVTWLQARCRAFHGERNDAEPSGNKNPKEKAAGSGAATDNENPLKLISKGRLLAFLATMAAFLAMVIYNLGGLLGFWSVQK